MSFTLNQIQKVYKSKGYAIYTKPYDINLYGIRTENSESNKFDDIGGFWCNDNKGNIIHHQFAITTDPGKNWLLAPMKKEGTAIMVPGQYRSLYKPGLHKGYPALVQIGIAKYVRDNNKDTKLNFELYRDPELAKIHVFQDIIASNYHGASRNKIVQWVGLYSAACQVAQDYRNIDLILEHVGLQNKAGLGDKVTYTLLEENMFR